MTNPFSLQNKHILITGASSGIGKQIAITAADMGASLLVSGRNGDRLNNTLQQLTLKQEHVAVVADLNDNVSMQQLVDTSMPLDGVVFSSGIMKTLPFKFVTAEELNNVMLTNFNAPILLLNKLIRAKKIKKHASVVFISSIGGNIIGTKGNSMYSASKGAINAMQKVLALELAAQGIRVNNISPGMVKTEMWMNGDTITNDQLLEDEKKYPLGYGEPVDVANAAVYLLSDASKWVTGITLVLDGGFSVQ